MDQASGESMGGRRALGRLFSKPQNVRNRHRNTREENTDHQVRSRPTPFKKSLHSYRRKRPNVPIVSSRTCSFT